MPWLDLLLLLFLLGFVSLGYRKGFVHTLGALMGTFVAAYASGRLLPYLDGVVSLLAPNGGNVTKLFFFIILFVLINRFIGFLFKLITGVLDILTHLPFLHSFNKMGGAIFGLFEGLCTMSMTLYMAIQFPVGNPTIEAIIASPVAKGFLVVAKILIPLLPEYLQGIL